MKKYRCYKEFFIKFYCENNIQCGEQEIAGYYLLRHMIKIPRFIKKKKLKSNNLALVYECLPSDSLLISNIINQNDQYEQIRKIYQRLLCDFNHLLRCSLQFRGRERVGNKLFMSRLLIDRKGYQNKLYLNELFGTALILVSEGKENLVDFNDIYKDCLLFFFNEKKVLSYFSQGDPTLSNITIENIWLDLEHSGINSFLGDIAILMVDIYLYDSYLLPKYYKNNSYTKLASFKFKNSLCFDLKIKNMSKHTSKLRSFLLSRIYYDLLQPKAEDFLGDSWKRQFSFYLITRLFTTFRFSMLELDDLLFLLFKINQAYISPSLILEFFEID